MYVHVYVHFYIIYVVTYLLASSIQPIKFAHNVIQTQRMHINCLNMCARFLSLSLKAIPPHHSCGNCTVVQTMPFAWPKDLNAIYESE